MSKPESLPPAVAAAIERWAKFHSKPVPELNWDGLMECYWFDSMGMFHGVELNGYIHT